MPAMTTFPWRSSDSNTFWWRKTDADLEPLLETLRSVGPKGAGNPEAARAWHELAKADGRHIPRILAALGDAGPLAANAGHGRAATRGAARGGKGPRSRH